MSDGLRLLLVRHGETDLNREHRMQGHSNLPLNARGRAQLSAVAGRVAGEGIDRVVASDLPRARESAEIVARPLGLAVETDARLREQHLGEWEGKPWKELPDLYPKEEIARFMVDPGFAPPGGETKRALRERLEAFLADLTATADGGTVLAVTHGGPLYVIMHVVLEMPYVERKRFYSTNAGLSEFAWTAKGGWRLLTYDEAHHLRGV